MEHMESIDEMLINQVQSFNCFVHVTRSNFKDQMKKENACELSVNFYSYVGCMYVLGASGPPGDT